MPRDSASEKLGAVCLQEEFSNRHSQCPPFHHPLPLSCPVHCCVQSIAVGHCRPVHRRALPSLSSHLALLPLVSKATCWGSFAPCLRRSVASMALCHRWLVSHRECVSLLRVGIVSMMRHVVKGGCCAEGALHCQGRVSHQVFDALSRAISRFERWMRMEGGALGEGSYRYAKLRLKL
jgi:hypothetical protein